MHNIPLVLIVFSFDPMDFLAETPEIQMLYLCMIIALFSQGSKTYFFFLFREIGEFTVEKH